MILDSMLMGESLQKVMEYCIWPSVSMLIGTLIVVFREPPETFKLMTQHFAAGIILSAVSTELLPQLKGQDITFTLTGFMSGVILMMVIEKISGENEEEEGEEEEDKEQNDNDVTSAHQNNGTYQNPNIYESPQKASTSPLPGQNSASREKRRDSGVKNSKHSFSYFRRQSQQNVGSGETISLLGAVSNSRGVAHGGSINSNVVTPVVDHMENGALYDNSKKRGKLPLTLAFTVYLDGFMDGFLIGISTIAGAATGLVMTIALTVEMTFLGITFSASTVKVKNSIRYPLICGAPVMILLGGILGTILAITLSEKQQYQTVLISFGAAALLYLVTEELLIEAHESGEGHKWYVDICFFVGFIASVVVEQGLNKEGDHA